MSSVHLFSVALTFFAIATAIAAERPSFTVEGRVYCDTCRTGFETPLTTYIAGKHILHFFMISRNCLNQGCSFNFKQENWIPGTPGTVNLSIRCKVHS